MAEGFARPPRQQVEPGTARPRQQPEVGSADIRFSENSGKPENSGTPIYGSRIRRQNRRQQVEPGTARYIEHKIKSPSDASRAAEMWYNHSIHSTI